MFGGPLCPIILQRMFLQAPKVRQKEAERFIDRGHWHSLPRLNPEADVPTVKLVGYWTSRKEIKDLYYEVYLLRRLPSLPPCRPNQMEEAVKDILSSLRSCLQRQGRTTILAEGQSGTAAAVLQPSCQMRSHSPSRVRDHPHDKALWDTKEAHWWALEAAHMLDLNIDRLSWEVDDIPHHCHHSHSCCWG